MATPFYRRELQRVARERRAGMRPWYGGRAQRRAFAPQRAAARRRRAASISRAQRGIVRTAGFYGRYGRGGELKFHDVDLDDAIIATGGTITDTINIIPQGVTEKTRVGRRCTIKKIQWRYDVTLPQTSVPTETADTVRVIMYLDKQCNGAAATALMILETDDFQSFNNLANTSRFTILMDRVHNMNSPSGAWDGAADNFGKDKQSYTFFKTCNIKLEYDDTAATGVLTTIRSNNLGVLILGGSGYAGISSKIRLRFSDE